MWKLYLFEVYSRNFWFVELLHDTVDFTFGIPSLDAYKHAAKSTGIIRQYFLMKNNPNLKPIQHKSNGIPLLELYLKIK